MESLTHRDQRQHLKVNGKMTQYPDTITISVTSPASQGSNGNWTAGISTQYEYQCRLEPNKSGRQVIGDDGVLRDFSYNCFMPRISFKIPTGSEYSVVSLNNCTISGTVKNSYNGQLNSRIWL